MICFYFFFHCLHCICASAFLDKPNLLNLTSSLAEYVAVYPTKVFETLESTTDVTLQGYKSGGAKFEPGAHMPWLRTLNPKPAVEVFLGSISHAP